MKCSVIMTSSLRHKHYKILERLSVHNQISIINCQVHGIPQDRCLCQGKNKSRISFILFLNEKSILVLDQGTNDEIISYQDQGLQLARIIPPGTVGLNSELFLVLGRLNRPGF